MNNMMILDSPEGGLSLLITERLRNIKSSGGSFSKFSLSSFERGKRPDLLVVSPKAVRSETKNIPAILGSCGILMTPGFTAPGVTSRLDAGCVVSCGMSAKDSVTLSSIGGGSVMLSIQRELPTVTGTVLERQEIPVRCPERASPEDALASSAALLLMGVPPGELRWG